MPTYTSNYSLHQWEDTDDFLRSDFNEDFQKIDTGLGSLKTNIATNAYNIYNLILQNYYENKYTGYKQALLFDGFMEEDDSRTLSDSVAVWEGALYCKSVGQTSPTWTGTTMYNVSNAAVYTNTLTATSFGMVTGYTFSYYAGSSDLPVTCYINGSAVSVGYVYAADKDNGYLPYTLETPIFIGPGDTVRFAILDTSSSFIFYGSSVTSLAGYMNITPICGETGSMTTSAALGSDWTSTHLWVRYSGGSLSPTVNDVDMTLSSTETTQTLDGTACSEDYWVGGAGADAANIVLNLTRGSDSTMQVHDYGILFL